MEPPEPIPDYRQRSRPCYPMLDCISYLNLLEVQAHTPSVNAWATLATATPTAAANSCGNSVSFIIWGFGTTRVCPLLNGRISDFCSAFERIEFQDSNVT